MAFTLWHPDAVTGSHPPHLSWVKTGKAPTEHTFSGLPLEADSTRTLHHVRRVQLPPSSGCSASVACRLPFAPTTGCPSPVPMPCSISQSSRSGGSGSASPSNASSRVIRNRTDAMSACTLPSRRRRPRPPGFNSLQQQARFDAFLREFNAERPHEALKMKRPAELYTPQRAPMPACRN
jgi:hypothetical protein